MEELLVFKNSPIRLSTDVKITRDPSSALYPSVGEGNFLQVKEIKQKFKRLSVEVPKISESESNLQKEANVINKSPFFYKHIRTLEVNQKEKVSLRIKTCSSSKKYIISNEIQKCKIFSPKYIRPFDDTILPKNEKSKVQTKLDNMDAEGNTCQIHPKDTISQERNSRRNKNTQIDLGNNSLVFSAGLNKSSLQNSYFSGHQQEPSEDDQQEERKDLEEISHRQGQGNNLNGNITHESNNSNDLENFPEPEAQEFNIDMFIFQERMYQKSYRSKLRSYIGMFLMIFMGSFFLPFLKQDLSPRPIFIIVYVGLAYCCFESIYRICIGHAHRWQQIEELFNFFDILSFIAFVIFVDIHLTAGFDHIKFAIIPPVLFSMLYHFSTTNQNKGRLANLSFRVLTGVQVLLITIKLDKDVSWSWYLIFCLLWCYFALTVFYLLVLVVTFASMIILSIIKGRLYQHLDLPTQFFGHIWNLLHTGLKTLIFTCLMISIQFLQEGKNAELLQTIVLIARYLSVFLVIYTVLTSRFVIAFLRSINHDDELEAQDLAPFDSERRLSMIKVEKKNFNLVKISSTYFLPLENSFNAKDKQYIAKLRQRILDYKRGKFGKETFNNVSLNKNRKFNNIINIEELKKEQMFIQDKIQNLSNQPHKQFQNKKKKINNDISLIENHQIVNFDDIQIDFSTIMKNSKAKCLSEGDQISFDNRELKSAEICEENDNNNCYICVQRPSDAVIMNCGHGGICFECALEVIKKKQECMQCRKGIERVIKINPKPRLGNIVKGYEAVELIFN